MPGLNELRSRLVLALDLEIKTAANTKIQYYLDPDGLPMGLVTDWFPDAPEKILQVIEQYGLNVQRVVDPNFKPRPGEEDKIVWQYHVWSRNPIYRSLAEGLDRWRDKGPRVTGPNLKIAVLTWAVLRAERVKQLRESKTEAALYNFNVLREKVYVSAFVE